MTLRQLLRQKGFLFEPENYKDDGGLVIQIVKEWLEEHRKHFDSIRDGEGWKATTRLMRDLE